MSSDGDCCYPVRGYAKCDKVEHWDEPEPCPLCTTSLLTREQFKTVLEAIAWSCRGGILYQDLLNHDAALRHTIKQQAQEIATLTGKLTSLCHAHGNALIEIHDLKQVIDSLHSSLHGKA